ncbi:hypothetical protein LSUE1_G010058 [Lachnellula suecica]|uniref:Pyrroloquinoline quinone-dependent pyranose dehydrogenase beta-propeller domain-containing protein n=1 Tax=Lachnellula suecica TaxID=602035 RepID=A0A8T9BVR8_9HELO|nr:hypothetical protein LSUE1_G010058 [Lachnellula suecica]
MGLTSQLTVELSSYPNSTELMRTTTMPRAGQSDDGLNFSRTLLVSRSVPNLLLVQRGSDGNIDTGTTNATSGRSQ